MKIDRRVRLLVWISIAVACFYWFGPLPFLLISVFAVLDFNNALTGRIRLTLLALAICAEIYLGFFGANDIFLLWLGSYENGRFLPYGMLWGPLNILYPLSRVYLLYVLGLEFGGLAAQYWFYQHGKLSFKFLFLSQVSNVIFVSARNAQSVSAILLAPFASVLPPLVLFEILVKIPFPGTPGFACAIGSAIVEANGYNLCARGIGYGYALYALLTAWVVVPIVSFYRRTRI